MPINILMPALSPTMEKGNLAKWHVKEGDKVASGDVIAEIETDKATMEVEAVDEGTIARILVGEGTADVPVNDIIAVLAGEGEDAKTAADAPSKAPAKPAGGEAASAKPVTSAESGTPASAPWDTRAPSTAAPSEGGSGSPASAAKGNGHDKAAQGGRVFASPLARRLAREGKIDLAAITGSGPHGRIVQRDVETALKDGAKAAAPAQARAPSAAPAAGALQGLATGMSDETIRKLFEPGSFEVVPHDGMRKTIARRLVEAKQTIPHFYVSADCRIDRLMSLRAEINAAAPVVKGEKGDQPAYKLSVNDIVIKALAMALRAVPDANVTWTAEGMLKHARVDVGVAVSIPGGLITPVVRNADTKSLSAISNEMKALARRARDRKLKPEEYQGGTTAVSNLGMYGVKQFQAIVNPPHATILAVGAGEQRAVVDKGQLAVATVMTATLSTDHRAVDGALAAELLAAFRRLIENPAGMLA